MSGALALAGLALRDLWISYRLLALLGGAALAGSLLPFAATLGPGLGRASVDESPTILILRWFGLALGAGAVAFAATAAAGFDAERRSGRLGWLAAAPVPRGALLSAWLLAFVVAAVGGVSLGGVAVWFGAASLGAGLEAARFALACGAATADLAIAAAIGLACGARLGLAAAPVACLLAVTTALPAFLVPDLAGWLPATAIAHFADLALRDRPAVDPLVTAGIGLIVVSLAAAGGMAALARADL